MSDRVAEISQFVERVLRHEPSSIGLALDPEGWARIDSLLEASAAHGQAITRQELEDAVAHRGPGALAIDAGTGRIRAVLTSVPRPLAMEPATPPPVLYHGTGRRTLPKILEQGLSSMARDHVQLCDKESAAQAFGLRRGDPAVLAVDSDAMVKEGHEFFLSEKGVWLTTAVPAAYLTVVERSR